MINIEIPKILGLNSMEMMISTLQQNNGKLGKSNSKIDDFFLSKF